MLIIMMMLMTHAHVQVTCSNKQELWYHEPEPVQVTSANSPKSKY